MMGRAAQPQLRKFRRRHFTGDTTDSMNWKIPRTSAAILGQDDWRLDKSVKKKSKISGYILRGTVAALLLWCVTIGLSWAINVTNHTHEASASEHNTVFGVTAHEGAASAEASAIQRNSTLTFADRVAYQRAIEEVYWQHRIWPKENTSPKPPLDKVMTQAEIEKKVEDYLRNSQAPEDYWKRPITPDQLQAEMERMANHTKQPEDSHSNSYIYTKAFANTAASTDCEPAA